MATPKPLDYFKDKPIIGAINARLGLLSFTSSTIFFPFVFVDIKRSRAAKVDKACNLNWPSLRSNLNAYLGYGENIKVDQHCEGHLMLPAWRTTCGAFYEKDSVVGRHQDGGYLISYLSLWEKAIPDVDPDTDFVKLAVNGSTVSFFHAKSKDEGGTLTFMDYKNPLFMLSGSLELLCIEFDYPFKSIQFIGMTDKYLVVHTKLIVYLYNVTQGQVTIDKITLDKQVLNVSLTSEGNLLSSHYDTKKGVARVMVYDLNSGKINQKVWLPTQKQEIQVVFSDSNTEYCWVATQGENGIELDFAKINYQILGKDVDGTAELAILENSTMKTQPWKE